MTCPDAAPSLGAYVLGALEPEERRQVEEHLDGCPACAAELVEFEVLPGLLDRVHPGDLQLAPVTPSPELFARMSAAAAAESGGPESGRPGNGGAHGGRSGRWLLVAAAVLVMLGAAVGVTSWAVGSGEKAHSATSGHVHMTVTVDAQDAGTALDVNVAGLPPHQDCRLVVVDRDGARHQAGEWSASYEGEAWFRGWTAVDRAALADVVLVGADGKELVRVGL